MGNIPKANIINGNTINAADVSNIINALDGTTVYDITISGSLAINTTQSPGSGHVITYNTSSGIFTYTSSAAIGGGTVTTDGTTIGGDGSVGDPITSLVIPKGGTNAIQVDNGSGLFDGNEVSTLNANTGLMSLGNTNTIIGTLNLVVGASNSITGNNSVIIGTSGSISGSNNLIVGSNNIVSSSTAAAIGIGLVASGSGQVVVGRYNAQGDSTSPFIVGIGTGSAGSARQTGFKVTQSGSMVTKFGTFGSGAPSWTGSQGELVVGKGSGNAMLWMYLGTGGINGWVSASFSS